MRQGPSPWPLARHPALPGAESAELLHEAQVEAEALDLIRASLAASPL